MLVAALVIVFIGVPLLELWVMLEIGSRIGVLPTIALLLSISVLGGWLVHRIGWSVWQRARQTVSDGALPTRELLDGAIVFGAGVLLIVPGFVTDLVGFIVLTPLVRALIRRRIQREAEPRNPTAPRGVTSEWTIVADSDIVDAELAPPTRPLPPAQD